MTPRPYQVEAMDALDQYLRLHDDNPVIEIPTGGGKTPIMAWVIERYLKAWPETRILILAHVRELLLQGVEKMQAIWPDAPIGVYCAALGKKERNAPITYASIQSIYKRAFDFRPFDLVFVDEAHRIPLSGETTYRQFLADARVNCPHQRVVGWTATPYRLGGGPIIGPDYILNSIAYRAPVRALIDDGYLCRLSSKLPDAVPDMKGVRIERGEFVERELEERFNQTNVVAQAVAEAVGLLAQRRATLFFCVSIAHAEAVSAELAAHNIDAPVICKDTPAKLRGELISRFKSGELRALCNVNVLSEGFDAQHVDSIVMLRPTQSAGLYYQQCGRGLRLHPSKTDTLVLDFAGNIERHGPIDALNDPKPKGQGAPPMKRCPECKELVLISVMECPDCGYIFPEPEPEPKPPHNTKPSTISILSEPWVMKVIDVAIERHAKPGKTPSLKVTYYGQLEQHAEWICLSHAGFARQKAVVWWAKRFGAPVPASVDAALPDLFSTNQLASRLKEITQSITVSRDGKYTRIDNHKLEARTDAKSFAH